MPGQAFRVAIRITMLVEIFGISGSHSRVQNCVTDLLALCASVGRSAVRPRRSSTDLLVVY